MHDLTLRQLEYFVALVEHGSVTAAAAACHVSQAAASMGISQLEKSLGANLLVRSRARKVVPTAAGIDFAAKARAILAMVSQAAQDASEEAGNMSGPLRIGSSQSLSPRLIPPLVAHFTAHYPDISMTFTEDSPVAIQEQVRQGQLDFALVYVLQAEPDLAVERLSELRLNVLLPANHRLAGHEQVELSELSAEPAILLDMPPSIERVTQIAAASGSTLDVRWISSNMETVRSLVARGLGYGFVIGPSRSRFSYEGLPLATVPVAGKHAQNAIVAVLPKGHVPSRRITEALRVLREAEHGNIPDKQVY